VRQRGKGTFISENTTAFELPRYTGSIEDIVLMVKNTSTDILESNWIEPPAHICKRLKLSASDKVFKVEKIRRIENSPFSHVFNYLPPSIGEKLPFDLVKFKPMLMILENELGIRAVEAEQSMEATIADPQVASMLEIRVGDPLLKIERTVYDVKKNPVEYVSVLYRADKFIFTVKLKRKRTKNSIGWDSV
jgi:GntR family transcriptional regulator